MINFGERKIPIGRNVVNMDFGEKCVFRKAIPTMSSISVAKHRKFKEKEFGGKNVYYNKYGQLTHRGDPEHNIYGDEKDD